MVSVVNALASRAAELVVVATLFQSIPARVSSPGGSPYSVESRARRGDETKVGRKHEPDRASR